MFVFYFKRSRWYYSESVLFFNFSALLLQRICSLDIFVYDPATFSLFSNFSLIDAQKFIIPKFTILCWCLSWINQSMIVLAFFHWLSYKFSQMVLFILSKIALLTFRSSFLTGLIILTDGIFWKPCLCSFSDMNHFFSVFT